MSPFKLVSLFLALVAVSLLVDETSSWLWGRRRRRRRCSAVNCAYNNWSRWSSCGSCSSGRGQKRRYRSKSRSESCGGSCNINNNSQSRGCCCRINCLLNNWSRWGSCSRPCGGGYRYRTRSTRRSASCGGSACSNRRSQRNSCGNGCCRVNCRVNQWASWSTNCPCGTTATQRRYRSVSRASSCGGYGCPVLSQTRRNNCGCCRQNCQWRWGSWSSCSANCGYGRQTRGVVVTRRASCGGFGCPSISSSRSCLQYSRRDCQMNSWSSYGRCSANCGQGTMTRYRSVRVSPSCGGSSCPSTSQTVGCSAGCCPVNCAVNGWGSWGSCSASCGFGRQSQSRSVRRSASCGGSSCPALSRSRSCARYDRRNCVVSGWSTWSQCSNQCGSGRSTRTRRVTTAASCGGSCPSLSESRACTSYAANRDCRVNSWGNWGACSEKCALGSSYRHRSVSQSQNCRGSGCPSLSQSRQCGSANGGCAHNCNGGACSCRSGYLLNSDRRTCRPRNCGAPSVKFCPSGTTYGTTCKYATFSCPSGTTYGKACVTQCPNGYELKNGPSSITCQSSGAWTTYRGSYCSRINKPPSKVSLSRTYVYENVKAGSVVGAFTTTDPNPKDTHTYRLLDSANGKFKLVSGSSLAITISPNYEVSPKSFAIKVRSTDNKGLYLDATFTVNVRNVNERPTGISLSNVYLNENSAKGTLVGSLATTDPDNGQAFAYSLLDSASGRFRVNGNRLEVAASNTRCLAEGGSLCLLNYETQKTFTVRIRSRDNGSPSLYKDVTFTIRLRDVNDQPRNFKLSGFTMKEDAAVNTPIGGLSVSDEDSGQKITYTLSNDAGGRFSLNAANQVVRKTSSGIDYETTTSYKIVAVATDNGKPAMRVSKTFTIEILDVNEPPVSITFASTNGQMSFSDDKPTVKENSVKGTIVGTLVAYDADANQKLAFRLDDTAGNRFALKTSSVTCASVNVQNLKTKCTVSVIVNGVLNHEVDALHAIVVRVTDEHKLFKTARYSIKIVDVNDRPRDIAFSGGAQPSIDENENGKRLGSFTTTDDDPANVHTYTLTNSAGNRFVIKGSTLMTSSNANLNYEDASQYKIIVRSTDSGSPPLFVEKSFTVQVKDVNEVPTAVRLSNGKVTENGALNTVVGTLTATDPDNFKSVRQTFTYTIIDSAAGRFKVDKGVVKVAVSNVGCLKNGGAECKIDYEKAKSHKIVVRVTDNGSPPLQKDFTVTIAVTDANDQPRNLQIDTFSVKENAPAGTLVGTLSATDEDAGQSLTYKLTNDDNGQFKLKGNKLQKAKSADYETKTSHSVTIVVTDNGNPKLSMTKVFTIEVLNVNEPPVTIIFKDKNGQLSFGDNSPRVNENSRLKTAVGIVEAHDEDAAQKLTFSLDDDAGGLFQVEKTGVCSSTNSIAGVKTVCTASVTVSGALNYEGNGKHTIIVRATDKGGLFVAIRFTIAVVDVNDKPTAIQLAGGSPTAVENKNGAVVGGLVTTDDDVAQTHSYKLIDSAGGKFVVDGTEIKVSPSANLNYEIAERHTIVVMSTDSGSPPMSVTATFIVRVLDVNEKPTLISIDSNTVPENSGANTRIGKLSTVDPDNLATARQTFTYSMLDGASGRFRLDGGVVEVAASNAKCLALGGKECLLNIEEKKEYDVVVRATDSGSPALSIDYVLTIRLTDVNDRPRALDLSNDRVFENAPVETVVGKLSSTDEDVSQTITYTLIDDDNGRFKIVGDELRKAMTADYETFKSHTVIVEAKDNGKPALSITKSFTVEVIDVNEAPIRINVTDENGQLKFSNDDPRVEELSPVGTVIGEIVALDHDENETLTFRLDDAADGRFSLGASASCKTITDKPGINTMCWTTLTVNGDLDYEANSKHYIDIRVTDSKGLFFTRRYNVDIVDVNDVPHNIDLTVDEVDENLNDQLIGDFVTEDQDPTHTHTCTLVDDANGLFVVKNCQLYTAQNAGLNFEAKSEYNVTVRSTDDGVPPLYREETFLITVLDVNENPTLVIVSNLNVTENSPVNAGVGIITVVDPDNFGPAGSWQNHTCSAIDNAGGRFVIEDNALMVADSSLNFETNSTWPVVIRCVDDGIPPLSRDQAFVVVVTDVNEMPTNVHMQGGTVAENQAAGQLVAEFTTDDPDNEVEDRQTFVYMLENVPVDFPFHFVGNELTTMRSLDFEETPSWKVVVRSTDSGGLYITETFQVDVTDENDRPTGIQLIGPSSVPENSVGGTYVGHVFTFDEDFADTHAVSIVAVYPGSGILSADRAVSGLFQVNSLTGILSVMDGADLNYEAVTHYTVEVLTVDSGSPPLSFTGSVVVNITDLNEKPTNITLTNQAIVENSRNGTVVATIVVSDPDNENSSRQKHACVVLDFPEQPFKVVDNVTLIVARDELNYEEERNYTIDIRCFDDGVPITFFDQQFLIEVLDVNEAPTFVGLTDYVIDENLDVGTTVGIITSTDPDNEVAWVQNVTYALSGNASVPFAINGTDLVATAKFDYEVKSSYRIRLTAADNGLTPASTTVEITIRVGNVNDQPTKVVFKSKGVDENSPGGTIIGVLETVDEDRGQNHTYAIVPIGNVTTYFDLDGNTLVVPSGTRFNYEEENVYVVVIRTTDNGTPPLSYENDVIVNILDVNEPPTDIVSYYEDEIAENSPAGTFVANLTIIDPDFNQTHTCKLLNGSDFFTVVQGPTPELYVAFGADIDFERDPSIWVLLRCSDDGRPPLSLDHSFVVRVIDVNEPVTKIELTGSRRIRENLLVGAVIANVSVVDEDRGQTHYYSLEGFLANAFELINEGRELVVARPVSFDYESLADPVINVTVFVVDDGLPPLNFSETFFFTVIDINEAPTNITLKGGPEVPENASPGDLVGVIEVFNPESNGAISYVILSVNGIANSTDFYLVTNASGTFLYLNQSLNYDNISSFALEILASDSDDPPMSSVLTLDVDVRRTDPCALGTAGCDDPTRATCIRTNATTSRCECLTGYSGDGVVCNDIDYCEATPTDSNSLSSSLLCNNGTCVDQVDGYECRCNVGFLQPDCSVQVDECASNPCGVGGNCLDFVNGFACSCSDGYRGDLCEENVDDCASSPCFGASTCVDGVATFRCLCSPDYTGDLCSFLIDACEDRPCRQETCIPKPLGASVATNSSTLPSVVISTGGNVDHLCVPDQFVVTLPFTDDLTPGSVDFQTQLERYLKDNLYVPLPDPDDSANVINFGISSVYVIDVVNIGNGEMSVHFVVLFNDEPVPVNSVLIGLKTDCDEGSMSQAFGSEIDLTCKSVLSRSPNETSPTHSAIIDGDGDDDADSTKVEYTWVIAAISGVALLVLSIMLTLIIVRKRQRRKRLAIARASFPFHGDSAVHGEYVASNEAMHNPIYEPTYTGGGIRNPIYCDDGDFDDDEDDDEGIYDNRNVNPIFSDSHPVMENPIYDFSVGDPGEERAYDVPRDLIRGVDNNDSAL